jgi:DNA polymerase-1
MLLEHRSLTKLHGTYIVGLSTIADPNGRIHTRFNQDVARTGRLSSADPNLQNIPNVEKDKWRLRGAFRAPRGRKLIVADYSQLEMRLLACASREPDMIGIFAKKWDIHMGNAALVFGIPYEEIEAAKKIEKQVKQHKLPESALTPRVLECLHARGAAKSIGFGLNYGMGEEKMANSIGCSRMEASQKIEQYKATYPAVSQFYKDAIQETINTGYAFTILGRRRNLPEILSANRGERGKAERQAVNLPIQGSAADVVKCAQIILDMSALDRHYDCHSLLQVHDELVHEAPEEYAEKCKSIIVEHMEHPFFVDLDVRLEVEAGIGDTWLEAK